MTVDELRKALEGVDGSLEVVLRCSEERDLEDGGDVDIVCGAVGAEASFGCSDEEAFVIDGYDDPEEDDEEPPGQTPVAGREGR